MSFNQKIFSELSLENKKSLPVQTSNSVFLIILEYTTENMDTILKEQKIRLRKVSLDGLEDQKCREGGRGGARGAMAPPIF